MPDANDYSMPVHVENRRLVEMAAGTLKLSAWEKDHLHDCGVCQAVLSIFLLPQLDVIQ
jgi:hypothetical protein